MCLQHVTDDKDELTIESEGLPFSKDTGNTGVEPLPVNAPRFISSSAQPCSPHLNEPFNPYLSHHTRSLNGCPQYKTTALTLNHTNATRNGRLWDSNSAVSNWPIAVCATRMRRDVVRWRAAGEHWPLPLYNLLGTFCAKKLEIKVKWLRSHESLPISYYEYLWLTIAIVTRINYGLWIMNIFMSRLYCQWKLPKALCESFDHHSLGDWLFIYVMRLQSLTFRRRSRRYFL